MNGPVPERGAPRSAALSATPSILPALQALLLALLLAALLHPAAVRAAVPHEDAVPAYAEEQTILQQEKDVPEPGWTSPASGRRHFDRHYIEPPGLLPEQDVILQRGGNTWRVLRNGPLSTIAGTLMVLALVAIFVFYRLVGAAPEPPESGRRIQRFSGWERLVHWATAIAFLVLAASGLVILFGKKILLPWMGHDVFSWLAILSKYAHNFFGPLFIFCSLVMFATFVGRNVFRRVDWQWIRRGGGLVSHQHVPAGFFNAGEKLWFWGGVTLLGLLMSATGLMLDFPYFKAIAAHYGMTRYLLQLADYLHLAGATLYIVAAMGHIYIGTWGTPGAYRAMREGTVDEAWARAHHELWVDELHNRPAPDAPLAPGAIPHPRS